MSKNVLSASVLAFEKKLVPSDALLYGTTWEDRYKECKPLSLVVKSVRGTISNRLKPAVMNDPAKLNAKIENPNLQKVDVCALGPGQDTLKVSFTLRVLSGVETPSACNNADYGKQLTHAVLGYIQRENFDELGKRYAINIANGRFLWRNRFGAEQIETVVTSSSKAIETQSWKFDSTEISTKDFQTSNQDIIQLGTLIAETLSGKNDYLLLEINSFAKIGRSQEVYPSEELVFEKGKKEKSKILYSVNGIAGMHSQKIGNAIRTIDTWYPEHDESTTGPIAIEIYGAVTNLGKAYRTPKDKKDFYTLFDKFALGEQLSSVEDEHYVLATLVRGGVFGEKNEGVSI